MVVKAVDNWDAQNFRIEVNTLSGPAAFLVFCLRNSFLTYPSSTTKGGGKGMGWAVTGVVFSLTKRP